MLPFFLCKGEMVSWLNPADPILMAKSGLFQFCLPTVDVITDYVAGVSYIMAGDTYFGIFTIGVTFLPTISKMINEITTTLQLCAYKNERGEVFRPFSWDRIKAVIQHVPFVQPFAASPHFLMLTKCHEGETKMEEKASILGTNATYEPYMEGGPQLILQLYILMIKLSSGGEIGISVIWAIASSLLSISLASASTFLLERVDHAVPTPSFLSKGFLSLLFLTVLIPRAMAVAVITYTFRLGLVIFLGLCFLFVGLTVRFTTSKHPPSKWILNQDAEDESRGIKGFYEEQHFNSAKPLIRELKTKAVLLSTLTPSIVGFKKSKIFEASAISSTLCFVIGIVSTWLIFAFTPSLTEFNSNQDHLVNGTQNCTLVFNTNKTITSENISIMCASNVLDVLFPVILTLLILSVLSLCCLSYLSNLLNLKKILKGQFNHTSVVAQYLQEEAEKQHELEEEAKKKNAADWRWELNKMFNAMDKNKKSPLEDYISDDIDLRQDLIINKQSQNIFIKATAFNLAKNLRWSDIHLSPILKNIRQRNLTDQLKVSTSPNGSCSSYVSAKLLSDAVNQNNFIKVYKVCKTSDVNETISEGNALCIASSKGYETMCELLLFEQASVLLQNKAGYNAFQLAVQNKHTTIAEMLLKKLIKDGDDETVLLSSCQSGDSESVDFCLQNFAPKKVKQMLESNSNTFKDYALYIAVKAKQPTIVEQLLSQLDKLNRGMIFK